MQASKLPNKPGLQYNSVSVLEQIEVSMKQRVTPPMIYRQGAMRDIGPSI